MSSNHETRRRDREHATECEENVAPAEQIAEHAAGGLPEQLAENVARCVARQDRLQAIVRRHVAEIRHRNRDHPAGRRAGREARKGELRQGRYCAAECDQDGGKHADDGDRAIFPEAVGHRPDHELNCPVGDGVSRDHDGGDAHGGLKVGCDLRQQRIGDAHLRLGGKARRRQQQDRARRNFLRRSGSRLERGQHGAEQLSSQTGGPERRGNTGVDTARGAGFLGHHRASGNPFSGMTALQRATVRREAMP